MASPHDNVSMAVFCDFENVALGVRDAKYEKFDIKRVLERLLLKGSIVVKKAYCDWDRYKGFKATMHEASFELIEIPHVRQSGKNSADIRLVVDALDLCYTKSHVNTFVIISGDSDFSPLVSKLRENAKQVIGVGVKQSTSDLLIANCDEFIFYDDLVRESQRAAKREARDAQPAGRRSPDEEKHRRDEQERRKTDAIDMAVETLDALVAERGDTGKIWASMLKEAIKRRKPGFNESYYGFRSFGNLLEEAQTRGLLEIGRDEKSGTYVFRGAGLPAAPETAAEPVMMEPVAEVATETAAPAESAPRETARRRGRGGRKAAAETPPPETPPVSEILAETAPELVPEAAPEPAPAPELQPAAAEEAATEKPKRRRKTHGTRKTAEAQAEVPAEQPPAEPAAPTESAPAPAAPATEAPAPKPARKPASRTRRPRKTETTPSGAA